MSNCIQQAPSVPIPLTNKPAVVFLLALWGKSYIEGFFDFGLRSLLAPGNIPAMSQEYACSFLFLTTEADIPFFKAQPVFAQLMSYCQVDFIEISDLIFQGNYSATLTLAYERGMRSIGKEMCQTYFFFLVSDYIMADGSLRNVRRYLKAGYSGITTGNFLVVEEYIAPILKEKIAAEEGGTLSLNAREILRLAFPCLHPVSLGHTVTQSFTHATHANRLFWKVNDHLMIGRFYLRHMLCIKPEIDDYVIGASCDYSFIPEMCPSGNVAHIQDSDDYCVIEMAPFTYEQKWLACGGHDISTLAHHFSNWTTHVHRANAHIPVLFHSEDLPEVPLAALQASAEFVQTIEAKLSSEPHPVRGHFYWISCMESIFQNILTKNAFSKHYRQGILAGIMGSPTFSPAWSYATDDRSLLKIAYASTLYSLPPKKRFKARLQEIMTGISPHTAFWNMHWFDDHPMKYDVQEKLAQKASCIVIAFEPIAHIIQWLEHDYPEQCVFYFYDLLVRRSSSDLHTLFQNKQHILICLTEDHLCELRVLLRLCAKYLPAASPITAYLKNRQAYDNRIFKQLLAIGNADLMSSQVVCETVESYYNIARAKFDSACTRYAKKLFAPRKHLWTRIIGFVGISIINTACAFCNLLALCGFVSKKHNTSAILQFRKL